MDLIQIRQRETLLVLHGPGALPPFRGAILKEAGLDPAGQLGEQPRARAEPRARGEIELALEGTPAQIEVGLARLGCLLEEARRWAEVPGGEHVTLEARVTPGGALWRARLVGGAVQPTRRGADGRGADERGAITRALGAQAARLVVERLDWWEGPEVELPLSGAGGVSGTGGIEIRNAWDAARANFVDIGAAPPGLEAGDLPAPLTLDFEGIDTDSTGTLYACQNIYSRPGELKPVLEGEAGAPGEGAAGSIHNDPSCGGGRFQRLAWSGEAQAAVWSGSLPPLDVGRYAGRAFLPVARLATPLYASDTIWHFWRLTAGGAYSEPVLDSPGCYLPIAAYLCPGGPLFIPPWPVGPQETPAGLGIELHAQAAGAGSHQLDLDYLYLLPLDGWRIYRPALSSWGSGLRVRDDPAQGTLRCGSWGMQTHTAEGPGLWLAPGRASRCFFLIERSGGGYGPDTRSRVRLFCRPRRRALV